MSTPSFGGRRVLAFESRRAKEIETLIATFDGRPIVAPAMREVPNDSDAAALELAHALAGGRFDAVIFLTGVGVRALVAAVDRAGLRAGAIGSDVGEGIKDTIMLLDARKRGFGGVERRHLAAGNRAGDLGGCHFRLCGHGSIRP